MQLLEDEEDIHEAERAIDEIHTVIHEPQGYQKVDDEILYVHFREPDLWKNHPLHKMWG